METILAQISNLGFPIVLSIYLLVRLENKLDKLTESIQMLTTAVAHIPKNQPPRAGDGIG